MALALWQLCYGAAVLESCAVRTYVITLAELDEKSNVQSRTVDVPYTNSVSWTLNHD